jgi:hypothetical protein
MHQAAIADRGKQEWKSKIEAENASTQTAVRDRNGVPRAEGDVIEYAAIFAKRDFALGSAIEVIENGLRKSFAGDGAEILDADNARGCDGSGGSGHVRFDGRLETVRNSNTGDARLL